MMPVRTSRERRLRALAEAAAHNIDVDALRSPEIAHPDVELIKALTALLEVAIGTQAEYAVCCVVERFCFPLHAIPISNGGTT